MDAHIVAIGTANPKYKIPQGKIAHFMAKAHQLDMQQEERLRILYRATGISHRYSVLEDYGLEEAFSFFPNTPGLEPFPDTVQRMQLYKNEALPLSLEAIKACLSDNLWKEKGEITHLITVSCTGMYAPGLDIDIVKAIGLNSHIQRSCINFMGCYAAFNALKTADAICRSQDNAKVLVVCTELCSIHFQKENTEDNYLSNALFADGSAALLMQSQCPKGLSIATNEFHCALATEGEQDMAWGIGNFGFEMKLSAYVPDIIKKGIKQLTSDLLEKAVLKDEKIDHYAVHPGGKRILEVIEQTLGIEKSDNFAARQVLRDYGNMSSCTILFVLKVLFDKLTQKDHGRNILGVAFGPGLTLESMLLKAHFGN